MRSLADARLKRTRAVELLAQGYNYDEIAQAVGFTNRGSAHRAVTKALAAREIEAVDELRTLELDRLDYLWQAHWHQALAGDIESAKILLQISAQRLRWYGCVEKRTPTTDSALYGGAILVQPWLEGNLGEATESQVTDGMCRSS